MKEQNTIKTPLLEKKNKPKELFEHLLTMWRKEYKEDNKETPKLIIELNKFDKIDFCRLALDAINEGFNCWNVLYLLKDIIPHLELTIESTLELLEKLYESTQNDLASGHQYTPIAKLVDTQPAFSRKLLDELLKQDKPFISAHISSIYQKLSQNNENEIHRELSLLKAHPSVYVVQGVVNALGNLDYEPVKNQSLLKKTLKILDELESNVSTDINISIVYAYGRLLKFTKEAQKQLLKFARKKDPKIDYVISRILFEQVDEYGNEEWFSELLMELTTTSSEHKGTIKHYLDHVLYDLITKKGNWDLVELFFTIWLIKSDYNPHDKKLSDLFGSTFHLFFDNKNKLERLITTFLNHDSHKVHSAAAELIRYYNLHKGPSLKLEQSILSTLSYEDLLFICRKILGYVYFSNTLCSLTFSILDKSRRSKKIKELVYSIFVSYIGENYPGATIEFLKQETSKSRSKIKKKIAEDIIKEIKNSQNARHSLPRLRELIPPNQHTYLVSLENQKTIQEAMESAQENSIVNLFTRIPLKHGTGWFSFLNDKYTSTSKLSSYSSSMELPISERFHPVYAARERAGFCRAKRGAK